MGVKRNQLYWDELRQCGIARPQRTLDDGYRRPDPRYCHDYPDRSEVRCTPAVKSAMAKMEERLNVDPPIRF